MDTILIMDADMASRMFSRQWRSSSRDDFLAPSLSETDEKEEELQEQPPPLAASASPVSSPQKSRHERYISELYFADDDLTETTVGTALSWHWSEENLASCTRCSSNCYDQQHTMIFNRLRTQAMDQDEIECILVDAASRLALSSSLDFSSTTTWSSSLESLPGYFASSCSSTLVKIERPFEPDKDDDDNYNQEARIYSDDDDDNSTSQHSC